MVGKGLWGFVGQTRIDLLGASRLCGRSLCAPSAVVMGLFRSVIFGGSIEHIERFSEEVFARTGSWGKARGVYWAERRN